MGSFPEASHSGTRFIRRPGEHAVVSPYLIRVSARPNSTPGTVRNKRALRKKNVRDICFINLKTKADIFTRRNFNKFILKKPHDHLSVSSL